MKSRNQLLASIVVGCILAILVSLLATTFIQACLLAFVGAFMGYEIVELWDRYRGTNNEEIE